MRIQSERHNEAEVTYWQSRVASLELIVCELLTTNQRLRSDLIGVQAQFKATS